MLFFEIIFYLFAILISLALAFFIFSKRKTPEGKAFSLAIAIASLWIALVFLFFFIDNEKYVLWLGRATFAIYPLMLLSLYGFVRLFPSKVQIFKKRINFLVVKILTVFFSLLTFLTPFIIEDEVITGIAERDTIYGPLYWLWIAYFLFLFLLIFSASLSQYRKAKKGIEKKQILYVLIGTCVAIVVGFFLMVVLTFFGIDEAERYGGPIGLLIFFIFTSYAILKHRLMDITFATGRVITYFFTFLCLGLIAYVGLEINKHIDLEEIYIVILIAILSGLLFGSFFTFFERFFARYLYYSFYSSQEVLTDLSRKLVNILNIDRLTDLITRTIMDTMKLDKAVILLRDSDTGRFYIKRNFGFREENGISLVEDNYLTEHLKRTQRPLVYEELSSILNNIESEEEREKINKLRDNMEHMEASLCNLLMVRGEIIGMIVLGEKKSKDPYTEQDVNLLDNLCKQISVSVENARLYSEVEDLSKNLEKKVDEQVGELKKAYKKLQRLDKVKTEFMSIVSHQLRTPLSIVKGHLSMINEGVYDDDEERKKEILDNVYEANERLIALVNDVLNISRIQSGRVELKKEEVDVVELVRRTTERMMPSASGKDIKVVFHKTDEDVPKIKADVSKTENVVINLIDNAIKYTDEGTVETSVKKEEGYVVIEIKDSGEGMSKEEIEKLFETFSRGDAGKKMWIQGAGLGLYIARQFVEMQGGKVWANSEGEGKGSQFYIKLPIDI